MTIKDHCRWLIVGVSLALLAGCQSTGEGPAPGESPAQQLRRIEPDLADQPLRVLLDFEADADGVFVAGATQPTLDTSRAHTGLRSLAGRGTIDVNLESLMAGEAFPGNWTMAGGFIQPRQDGPVKVSLIRNGQALAQRTVSAAGGKWSAVFLDLGTLPADASPEGSILRFESAGAMSCDDVLLSDNRHAFVDTTIEGGRCGDLPAWSIKRSGLLLTIDRPNAFTIQLKPRDGLPWTVVESSALRGVFRDAAGTVRTVYCDGRSLENGKLDCLGPSRAQQSRLTAQHAAPAAVRVPEEMGRLERRTPGDANNDGYCELLGSYQIAAIGRRLEVAITPGNVPVAGAVLEIANLPPGDILATAEGKLITTTARTSTGSLLVQVPDELERTTILRIAVK